MIVTEIFELVERLRQQEGIAFLVVEQNANVALAVADHGYVMENGRIVLYGTGPELRENEDIKEFYLGVSMSVDGKSFKDVPRNAHAEVEFLDVLVLAQLGPGPVQNYASVFHHVAVVGDRQRHVGVLLDDKERDAFLLPQALDQFENLGNDHRRQSQRRLVEQDQPRPGHKCAPDH